MVLYEKENILKQDIERSQVQVSNDVIVILDWNTKKLKNMRFSI